MTEPQSPWTALLDKVAGVLIEAVDEGVAAAKRKANAPPPNIVPIRPDHQAMEIEGLKIEIKEIKAAISQACSVMSPFAGQPRMCPEIVEGMRILRAALRSSSEEPR